MKAKERSLWASAVVLGVLPLAMISNGYGQTQLNLATQGRNVDFTNAPYTKPIRQGASLPPTCSAGEFFLNTGATPGQNLFACLNNAWTLMGAPSGLGDPGSNGLVKRTGLNATTTVAAPAGTIVGTTDTQTLTGKSIDAAEINSGVFNAARIPALTGDVSSPSGSTAVALNTVLNNPGTFGDATHSLQVTVDSKGRVTSMSALPIVTAPTYYQQLSKAGTALAQRSSLNVSGAFSAVDNSAASRTDLDLATVNSTPGTFGGSGQIPVLTVNAYGQITTITTASVGSAGTNNASAGSASSNAGTLSAIPASCSAGNLYFATDQPAGQQIYACGSTNSWSQYLSVGGSGALAITNGSLDVVSTVVPRLTAANSFTGSNSFASGVTLASTGTQPTCGSTTRGLLWFQNNGNSKDGLQVCAYNGSAYIWASLY